MFLCLLKHVKQYCGTHFRYWVLLSKLPGGDSAVREPLYYACQLLHGTKVNKGVVQMLLDMLENLLRNKEELEIEDEAEDGMPLEDSTEEPLDVGHAVSLPKVDAGMFSLNLKNFTEN